MPAEEKPQIKPSSRNEKYVEALRIIAKQLRTIAEELGTISRRAESGPEGQRDMESVRPSEGKPASDETKLPQQQGHEHSR